MPNFFPCMLLLNACYSSPIACLLAIFLDSKNLVSSIIHISTWPASLSRSSFPNSIILSLSLISGPFSGPTNRVVRIDSVSPGPLVYPVKLSLLARCKVTEHGQSRRAKMSMPKTKKAKQSSLASRQWSPKTEHESPAGNGISGVPKGIRY